MPISEARKRANKKWNDAHLKERYDRINIVVPKGKKEKIQSEAKKGNESISGYINRAIDLLMDIEGSYGISAEEAGENNVSRFISHVDLFTKTELEKIMAVLDDEQTVNDYIKSAVLDKLK